VVILEAGEDHRIDHPVSGGDRSTVFVFPAELLDEAFRERVRWGGVLRPGVVMGSRLLRAMLRKGTPDGLETEELSLLLLEGLARDPVFDAAYGGRSGSGPRRRVERVRALLASRPGATWRLHDIALAVHCSPYHLARQFREVTGESVSRYLLQLRLAVALDRISEGEQDLAGLAADLGFAHHSHLSARFRSVFGMSPSSARDSLTTGRPEEMRTIVTAARPDAS
jgi:AraC-like DNA-binding protein